MRSVTGPPTHLELTGLSGIGEVAAGDDVGALLVAAAERCADGVRSGDVLVVSSKIVSKAQGRTMTGHDRQAAIEAETVRVVAERMTPRGPARIVQIRSGTVLAAAGVDASNVAPGTVLLLPEDCDAAARYLRARIGQLTGASVAVIVSDTLGRPWREGQTDVALGAAGIAVTDDLRGSTDTNGMTMEATVRAVGDELAGAADLVKGKTAGIPAALVRGLAALVAGGAGAGDGAGAAVLNRAAAADWFRLGHVEAVRTALGAPPGSGIDLPRIPLDDVPARLARAVTVGLAGSLGIGPRVTAVLGRDGARLSTSSTGPEAMLELGAAAARIVAAGWAEQIDVEVEFPPSAANAPLSVILTSPPAV